MGCEVRMLPVQTLPLWVLAVGLEQAQCGPTPVSSPLRCTSALFPAWCGITEALTYCLNPKRPGLMTENSLCRNCPAPLSPKWEDSAACVSSPVGLGSSCPQSNWLDSVPITYFFPSLPHVAIFLPVLPGVVFQIYYSHQFLDSESTLGGTKTKTIPLGI